PVVEVAQAAALESVGARDDDAAVLAPDHDLGLRGRGRLALALPARPLELGAQLLGLLGAAVEVRPRLAGRDRLDPPRAGADGALAQDRERPDLRRRAHVRAAAELARVARHLDDADVLGVLLADEHHRAEPPRLLH